MNYLIIIIAIIGLIGGIVMLALYRLGTILNKYDNIDFGE